jgi:hypothetical protein
MKYFAALPTYKIIGRIITILLVIAFAISSDAQKQSTTDTAFKPSGKLWGLAYGDFSFKAKSDPLNRGGLNQYTGIQQNESLFQFRRIYLGYDYEISKQFSATFLLASEDNEISTGNTSPTTTGDLLSNNKLSMFIKLASIKWNNIFPGADLSVGQVYTPASVLLSEVAWDYRCIERTVSDIRRTPAYDFGASLNGKFYKTEKTELGYNVMIGNGTAAKPENDMFKWFYGDVYAKIFNKKLILDFYSDYTRINWTSNWHHDRHMFKGMVAYTTPKFTLGTEAFLNTIRNDNVATALSYTDTITTKASAISIFARGRIYKDIVGFFIRYDNYNPSINNKNNVYTKYAPITTTYDPNTKEQFFTVGIDYSPISKIHIMPNVWYNTYNNAGPMTSQNSSDLVYRLSLYYIYGK